MATDEVADEEGDDSTSIAYANFMERDA